MTPSEVAHHFNARRVGDRRWITKCPAHDDRSPSLSIRAANNGRTLIHCFGGCRIEEVILAAGIAWSDLFPPSSYSPPSRRRRDPEKIRRLEAAKELRGWAKTTGRLLRDRLHRRHQLVTKGERLIGRGEEDRGWEMLAFGYLGFPRLSWLADLLDSANPHDWEWARSFLGKEAIS